MHFPNLSSIGHREGPPSPEPGRVREEGLPAAEAPPGGHRADQPRPEDGGGEGGRQGGGGAGGEVRSEEFGCSYGSVGRSMEKSGKFEFGRLGLA